MSPPVLSCEGLVKEFGSLRALDGLTVDLTAPATGLLGANGAGKSTFMKMALGLLAPDEGSVRVLGLDAATHRGQIRRRVGYMPEHACLPTDMSAQDICVLFARLRGLSRRDARRRASEVLFAVGLEEERHRLVETYSLGMAQRTKLAQALVHGPDLVLLDEPTSGLDAAGRAEMLSVVRHLSRDLGIQVVLSSHVLDDVERTCDQVVVLSSGRLAAQEDVGVRQATGDVVLQVTGGAEAFVRLLEQRGVRAHVHEGRVVVPDADARVLDLVRDAAADGGVGLRSMVDAANAFEDAVVGAMT